MSSPADCDYTAAELLPSPEIEFTCSSFDYTQLHDDIAVEIKEAAERVRCLLHGSVVDIDRELLQIKRRLKHGQFATWVRASVQSRCALLSG